VRQIDDVGTVNDAGKHLLLGVKRIARQFVPDAEIWLYGSSARGERVPDSDWDVLLSLA
jgi:predicted nucleotidyltransferase